MSLGGLVLLRPAWLLLLLGLPLLAWLWRRLGAASGGWEGVVDPHLLAHQLQRGSAARAPLWLALAAWTLAALALSGPAWREAPQALTEREAALAIVLELSDSMRAQDLAPDRLARARFAIIDLLRARRDGQFALVAYAGAPFTVAPVTDDGGTLLALLDALDPAQMPVGGADAAAALVHAGELLAGAGHATGEILLVADGAGTDAAAAAAALQQQGYAVSVLGVGTPTGAPVALPDGGFLKDASGAILVPGLEQAALQQVAASGGGRYATLSPGRTDLAGLLAERGGRFRDSEDATRRLADDGAWLVLLLLPLAAMAFRRGWLGCMLLLLCGGALLPAPARAMDWHGLWQRPDQRAWEALQAGEAARAATLARDPALRGAALYRAGEAEQASAAFAAAEGADAHYNRGNALAQAQRYEEAIAAYDQALELAPGMEDALANRQAVEAWLRRQQEQQRQDGDSQQGESGQQQDGQPQDGKQQDGQQQDGGQPRQSDGSQDGQQQEKQDAGEQGQRSGEESGDDDQATPGQQGEQTEQERQARQQAFERAMQEALERDGGEQALPRASEDPAAEEQRQAVEQWLRRVPDDPGGLLRRKFALEYQRRMREGGTD